jgi:hypothetical protein
MNILETLSRKDRSSKQPACCGEAIIAYKRPNLPTAIVGAAVRIEDGPPARLIKLERPALFELSDELRRAYRRAWIFPNRWAMTNRFFGSGIDAISWASSMLDHPHRSRLYDGRITFTRFLGVQLGMEWEGLAEHAVALACFHALGDPPLIKPLDLGSDCKEI